MNLYFTYESRDTLESFILFITVKTMTKLNLGHGDKFDIEILKKISRRGSRSSDNAEFGHFRVLQRTAKKCTKNYNARAQPSSC